MNVFLRHEVFFVHPVAETTRHFGIAVPPFLAIPRGNQVALREGVLRSLAASLREVEHPSTTTSLLTPLFKLARVRSYTAFAREAIAVAIERNDDRIAAIPMLRDEHDGFEEWPDATIAITDVDSIPRELENAVARILHRTLSAS